MPNANATRNKNANASRLAGLKSMAAALVNISITHPEYHIRPRCEIEGRSRYNLINLRINGNGARANRLEADRTRHNRAFDTLTRAVLRQYAMRQIRSAKTVAELDGFMFAWTGWPHWTQHEVLRYIGGAMQKKIRASFQKAIASPYTRIGQRRLRREFTEMQANLNTHLKKRART